MYTLAEHTAHYTRTAPHTLETRTNLAMVYNHITINSPFFATIPSDFLRTRDFGLPGNSSVSEQSELLSLRSPVFYSIIVLGIIYMYNQRYTHMHT